MKPNIETFIGCDNSYEESKIVLDVYKRQLDMKRYLLNLEKETLLKQKKK